MATEAEKFRGAAGIYGLFQKYATAVSVDEYNGVMGIPYPRMKKLMLDADLLEGVPPGLADACVREHMQRADQEGCGFISAADFVVWWLTEVAALLPLRGAVCGVTGIRPLYNIYHAALLGDVGMSDSARKPAKGMLARQFIQLATQYGLSKSSSETVRHAFGVARVNIGAYGNGGGSAAPAAGGGGGSAGARPVDTSGSGRLQFAAFVRALALLATRKMSSPDVALYLVVSQGVPPPLLLPPPPLDPRTTTADQWVAGAAAPPPTPTPRTAAAAEAAAAVVADYGFGALAASAAAAGVKALRSSGGGRSSSSACTPCSYLGLLSELEGSASRERCGCGNCGQQHTRWRLDSLRRLEELLSSLGVPSPVRRSLPYLPFVNTRNLRTLFHRYNAAYNKGKLPPTSYQLSEAPPSGLHGPHQGSRPAGCGSGSGGGRSGDGEGCAWETEPYGACCCLFRSLSVMEMSSWLRLCLDCDSIRDRLVTRGPGLTPARLQAVFLQASALAGVYQWDDSIGAHDGPLSHQDLDGCLNLQLGPDAAAASVAGSRDTAQQGRQQKRRHRPARPVLTFPQFLEALRLVAEEADGVTTSSPRTERALLYIVHDLVREGCPRAHSSVKDPQQQEQQQQQQEQQSAEVREPGTDVAVTQRLRHASRASASAVDDSGGGAAGGQLHGRVWVGRDGAHGGCGGAVPAWQDVSKGSRSGAVPQMTAAHEESSEAGPCSPGASGASPQAGDARKVRNTFDDSWIRPRPASAARQRQRPSSANAALRVAPAAGGRSPTAAPTCAAAPPATRSNTQQQQPRARMPAPPSAWLRSQSSLEAVGGAGSEASGTATPQSTRTRPSSAPRAPTRSHSMGAGGRSLEAPADKPPLPLAAAGVQNSKWRPCDENCRGASGLGSGEAVTAGRRLKPSASVGANAEGLLSDAAGAAGARVGSGTAGAPTSGLQAQGPDGAGRVGRRRSSDSSRLGFGSGTEESPCGKGFVRPIVPAPYIPGASPSPHASSVQGNKDARQRSSTQAAAPPQPSRHPGPAALSTTSSTTSATARTAAAASTINRGVSGTLDGDMGDGGSTARSYGSRNALLLQSRSGSMNGEVLSRRHSSTSHATRGPPMPASPAAAWRAEVQEAIKEAGRTARDEEGSTDTEEGPLADDRAVSGLGSQPRPSHQHQPQQSTSQAHWGVRSNSGWTDNSEARGQGSGSTARSGAHRSEAFPSELEVSGRGGGLGGGGGGRLRSRRTNENLEWIDVTGYGLTNGIGGPAEVMQRRDWTSSSSLGSRRKPGDMEAALPPQPLQRQAAVSSSAGAGVPSPARMQPARQEGEPQGAHEGAVQGVPQYVFPEYT
ncbi:hypothetical protein Agub_g3084 [Astrephomene gubernaculifera]|uniref:EF-hand domain-containing protein n=1 Tax=Astrephomene gubernaculifera TaxID=47775 RepID=A0AAD3DI04_9CHLO|nr:hypothetical protein Agub_g3084 [Astrephomene gubernaculifera]